MRKPLRPPCIKSIFRETRPMTEMCKCTRYPVEKADYMCWACRGYENQLAGRAANAQNIPEPPFFTDDVLRRSRTAAHSLARLMDDPHPTSAIWRMDVWEAYYTQNIIFERAIRIVKPAEFPEADRQDMETEQCRQQQNPKQ